MPYLKLADIKALPPTDGLVFYAPLDSDKATAETGQEITKYGSPVYTTADGIKCLYLQQNSGLTINQQISKGAAPFTVTFWAKNLTAESMLGVIWGTYIAGSTQFINAEVSNNFLINVSDSLSWIETNQTADRFRCVAVVYDGTTLKVSVDGLFCGSKTITLNIGETSYLSIGVDTRYGQFDAFAAKDTYVASLRAYNKALTDYDLQIIAHEFDSRNSLLIGGACLPLEPFEYEAVVLAGTENYEITGTQNTPVTPITFDAAASDGSTVNYAVTEGTLPDGITLSGGTLSGTPTGSGTSTVKITASSGDAALVITVTFSIAAPAVAKCPQNLTGFTSDPDWDVSGTDGAWVVFDGLNEPTLFVLGFRNQGVGVIVPADATVIRWTRTDGKIFSASSVILKTLHTSLANPFGNGSAIINLRLCAVLADGGTVDINSDIPWQSVSGGAVPVSVNPELELCGFELVMYGAGAANVYISEIEVE